MKNIRIVLLDGRDREAVDAGFDKQAANTLLDQEIEEFSSWMANIPDIRARGPLMNGEKALLKTYLIQKLKGAL